MAARKYLTDDELLVLRMVETTPEQARQIIRRNQPMLDLVREWIAYREGTRGEPDREWYDGDVGCPHCDEMHCNHCAWEVLATEGVVKQLKMACLAMTFGGVLYYDAIVEYGAESEEIIFGRLYEATIVELRYTEIFLAGHIEWAEDVLEREAKR